MTEPVIPAWAIWRRRRVRVLYYLANGNFMVLSNGEQRVLHRDQMRFIKGGK